MATFTARVAGWSARHAALVLITWFVLIFSLVGSLAMIGPDTSAEVTIPGTEAQLAIDALKREFPEASGALGQIVMRAPAGESLTEEPLRSAVLATTKEANALPGVLGSRDPFATKSVSRDGRYALLAVQFKEGAEGITAAQRHAYEQVGTAAAKQDITIARGGNVTSREPSVGAFEAIGVGVALVVLTLTLGSLVLAGLTMLNALVGVGVAMASLMLISNMSAFTSATPVIALMLGLAVAIDYSLFITSRYRHYLATGKTTLDALQRAAGTAGSAVMFAGSTVIIALTALTVIGIPFLSTMGLAAAAAGFVGVLIALTLLPAALSLLGKRALGRRAVRREPVEEQRSTALSFRWARTVVRWRIPVIIAVVIGLVVLATPTLDLRLSLSNASAAAKGTEQRRAYDLITEGFGAGANAQLAAVVFTNGEPDTAARVAKGVVEQLRAVNGVAKVSEPRPNQSRDAYAIAITPTAGPTTDETIQVVHDARDAINRLKNSSDVDVAVTGSTAVSIDVSEKLLDALPLYVALVVGLSLLMLTLVFRSIVVPIKATLGFLLSASAAFGVTIAVFQWGWFGEYIGLDGHGPLISFLPILHIGILFGLAMDYEVFIVSRMREEFAHGKSAADAIVAGVGHGAPVVAAAAAIMVAVFSGFIFNDDPVIKSLGFTLAVGVLIDAFIIRLLLVPAVMSLLGDRAWWLPRWLDRFVPTLNLDEAVPEE